MTDKATLEEIRDHLRLIQTAVARGFGTDYMEGVAKSAIRDLDGLIAERSQERLGVTYILTKHEKKCTPEEDGSIESVGHSGALHCLSGGGCESMSEKNKCETCKWWGKQEAQYHPMMDARAVKAHQDEMIECGHMGDCSVFPSRQKTSGKHFCGQWGGKDGARSKLGALIESSEQAATFLERAGDTYGIAKYILRPAIEAAK